MITYRQIRESVRKSVDDISGFTRTDSELDFYIDRGQREYARRSLCLTGKYVVSGLGPVFIAPSDYIIAYRFTDVNQVDLPFFSFKQLSRDYTAKFLTETGTPLFICINYEDWNRFRFYPNPTSEDIGTLHYYRYPESGTLEIKDLETLKYFTLFKIYINESEGDFINKGMKYYEKFIQRVNKRNARGNTIGRLGASGRGTSF